MDEYRKAEDKLKKKKRADKNHGKPTGPKMRTTGDSEKSAIHTVQTVGRTTPTVSKAAHRKNSIQKKRGTIKKR